MSLADDRFDDNTWRLLFASADSSNVKLHYATPNDATLIEVTYKSQDVGSFTSMGGAGANLRTGEEVDTPINDQLFGLNDRPAIWKNKSLTLEEKQSFATEQIALINAGGIVPAIVGSTVSPVVPRLK